MIDPVNDERMSDRNEIPPLPREWLPEPLPAPSDASWEVGVQRIMSAARPELAKLGTVRSATPWWAALETWARLSRKEG